MHVFIALLNSPPLQNMSFKIKEQSLPPITFADDCIKVVSLKDSHDVSIIKKLIARMKEAIDLEINFSKTKILTNAMEIILKVCLILEHPANLLNI